MKTGRKHRMIGKSIDFGTGVVPSRDGSTLLVSDPYFDTTGGVHIFGRFETGIRHDQNAVLIDIALELIVLERQCRVVPFAREVLGVARI